MAKTINWAAEPSEGDVADASHFLTLLRIRDVTVDRSAGLVFYPAKDLLRASGLSGLPQTNEGVARWTKRLKTGSEIPPVLLVRHSLMNPLIIAEGYHRVSACYLLDEKTEVGAFFLLPGGE